jgi:hypothetical protein
MEMYTRKEDYWAMLASTVTDPILSPVYKAIASSVAYFSNVCVRMNAIEYDLSAHTEFSMEYAFGDPTMQPPSRYPYASIRLVTEPSDETIEHSTEAEVADAWRLVTAENTHLSFGYSPLFIFYRHMVKNGLAHLNAKVHENATGLTLQWMLSSGARVVMEYNNVQMQAWWAECNGENAAVSDSLQN